MIVTLLRTIINAIDGWDPRKFEVTLDRLDPVYGERRPLLFGVRGASRFSSWDSKRQTVNPMNRNTSWPDVSDEEPDPCGHNERRRVNPYQAPDRGDFTRRIVISLSVCVVVFVLTVALAMVDSSGWPGVFFWLTMITVVFLNMANGIYQTTVYGIAAKLPPKYSGAVVLGSNVSGTFTAIISIVSKAMSPNLRTAAIYYFITALFVLLACFDTYFALPLSRFYRYHTRLHDMPRKRNSNKIAGPFGEDAGTEVVRSSLPKTKAQIYWHVFKRCFPQCFNVFLTLFVSLAVFPAVQANIKMSDPSFIIPEAYYTLVLCFLTFNLFATFGNLLPNLIVWPGPRWLWVPVVLRLAFIPAFLLCRYQPVDVERITPIYIENDWIYWAIGAGLGLTSGYYSSLAMMFGPASVEEEYASIAGMFCAASLVTGVFAGVNFSLFSWWFVQNVTWVL
ncbi:unnamed protein product [Notodromas monacha]|uniref:Equilibrative nucleoside transporter 1 n=1 Tax=Notodromas monacha TaxID=399045 RepID=A0A7R9GCX8_9CRUS|nr:unnamed protein product [Notodromas monacha]CAG0918128.1 unnamed protein product [Notodromas monacha]